MLINRNQLPDLTAISSPSFEQYLADFKADFVAELRKDDDPLASEVEQVLAIESELITKFSEMFIIYMRNRTEADNENARQMLPMYAKDNNLDHVVSLQGLLRQLIDAGDPNAIPPVPATKESDEHLLQRFWLAPNAPAAGSKLQYKFQCLTLDERPVVVMDKPADNQVRLTYTFSPASLAAQVKDGGAKRTSPGVVTLTVLSNTGSGIAAQALLDGVIEFFNREDVRPETDDVIVQSATIQNYTQEITATVADGPDTAVFQVAMQEAAQNYADDQHLLGGKIDRDYINHLMYANGAKGVTVTQPAADIISDEFTAPYCTAVTVTVNTL